MRKLKISINNHLTTYVIMLVLFFIILSPVNAKAVSDTWANVYKKIAGNFSGPWSDTQLKGPDSEGYDTILFYLIPGANFEYKFKADPDSDGNYSYEPSFSTPSGNRELTVVDDGSGSMTIIANWADTPPAPYNLIVTSDSGKVHLKWSYPTGDSGVDVIYGGRYNIYYDTETPGPDWVQANSDTVETTSFTVTGLQNDSLYYFYVEAIDAYGVVSDSSSIETGIPVPTVNVTFRVFVGGMDDSQVLVGIDTSGWVEIPLNNEGGTSYWAETITMFAHQNVSYKFIIIDSSNNKTYEYPYANGYTHMFIYPDTTGVSKVEVQGSWNSWGARTELTLYPDRYWRGDVSVNAGANEYKFILNGSNYVFDPLNPYTQNNNSLLMVDALPTSSYMREFTVPTSDTVISKDWEDTPPTPSGFTATPMGVDAIRLDWNAMTLTEDVDSFVIEYTETPTDTTTWITWAEVDGNVTSYTHNNLILGDTYYYRIWAVDYAGNVSQYKNFTYGSPNVPVVVIFVVDADKNYNENFQ